LREIKKGPRPPLQENRGDLDPAPPLEEIEEIEKIVTPLDM
jgi:hypothetical protein